MGEIQMVRNWTSAGHSSLDISVRCHTENRLVPLDKAFVERISSNIPSRTRNPTDVLHVNNIIIQPTLPTSMVVHPLYVAKEGMILKVILK